MQNILMCKKAKLFGAIPRVNPGIARVFCQGMLLSAFILPGRDPFIFFEGADKIAQVIEPVAIRNFRDGIGGGGKLVAGLFDPLVIQIIHGGLVGHFGKKTAKVFGRHGYRSRKLFQCQGLGIVVFNEFQNLLQLKDSLVISAGLFHSIQVVMITKNNTEKVVKLSNDIQLITFFLLLHGIENTVENLAGFRILGSKMMIYHHVLVYDLLHIACAQGIVLQKRIDVKYNTLIDTITGDSGVKDSTVDKNDISRHGSKAFFV